ncbi:MAG: TonB family protein [Proteobacteria bacterium]|nr:TonB family protein [Pseudomonadota bacterium]
MSSSSTTQRFVNVPISSVLISLLGHVAVVFLLVSLHLVDGISFFNKKEIKEPYQSFIQVDVVALPDQLPKDMANVDMSQPIVDKPSTVVEKVQAPPTPADLMKLPDKKGAKEDQEKKTRQEILEQQAKALKKLQDDARREQALKELMGKPGKKGRAKLAGNMLSQGNSAVGMIGTASDQYRALVSDAIRKHFNIYLWQQKKGTLVTDIYIEVYPNGRVKAKKVVKPSTDSLFDSAVLQAIDASQPLPVPEDISLLKEGFQITFKP